MEELPGLWKNQFGFDVGFLEAEIALGHFECAQGKLNGAFVSGIERDRRFGKKTNHR